jgi:hypothetical protein
MKILFFISVKGHGKGGHFNSLNHITKGLSQKIDCKIITLGPGKSNLMENNPNFLKHIKSNGLDFLLKIKEIKQTINNYNPTIIHTFDIEAYNYLRIFLNSIKYKFIVNKCGGPNPISFPKVENLVLFSLENLNWFKNQKVFNKTIIHLIPNRTQSLENSNQNVIGGQNKDKSFFNLVRIGRIGTYYEKSFIDSINLIKFYKENGFLKIKLYIIGTIEDENVFQNLKNQVEINSLNVTFLNEELYTTNASKMLYLADAVIATGRGLMEASSLGKPLFAIVKNFNMPIIIDETNFDSFYSTNFSERNYLKNINEKEVTSNYINLVNDTKNFEEKSNFSKQIFTKYFDLNLGIEKYLQAYQLTISNKNIVGFFKNLKFKLITIYSYYKASKNATT